MTKTKIIEALSSLLPKKLHLFSDESPFAYKSGTSTIQCPAIVTETIKYYIHNENIYVCWMDASKAFDTINLTILFQKLCSA